jgi:hypothetical protein
MVPCKKYGSCGMPLIFDRMLSRDKVEISRLLVIVSCSGARVKMAYL